MFSNVLHASKSYKLGIFSFFFFLSFIRTVFSEHYSVSMEISPWCFKEMHLFMISLFFNTYLVFLFCKFNRIPKIYIQDTYNINILFSITFFTNELYPPFSYLTVCFQILKDARCNIKMREKFVKETICTGRAIITTLEMTGRA